MISREQSRGALTGPIVSVCPFFNRDGSIDWHSVRNEIDFVIDTGCKTVLLTCGDSLLTILTEKEIADLTRVTVEHTAGRAMTVAAGTPRSEPLSKPSRQMEGYAEIQRIQRHTSM